VDFQTLLDQGFATLPLPDAPFAQGGFPTPSGRCTFFNAGLAAMGLDGLPDHLPNFETPGSSERYPLAMISPPARNFLNSTFVNVKSLRDIEGEPVLELHAADAAARNISARPKSRSAPGPVWSTAWASGGASSAWPAPTSTSSPAST